MDIEKRNQIILDHIGLIWSVVNKFKINSVFNEEDYFQVAVIGMIKAIENFDKDKKTELSTWMFSCMYNEILGAIKWRKKHNTFPYISIEVPEFENDRAEDYYFMDKIKDSDSRYKMFTFEEVENNVNNDSLSNHIKKYLNGLADKEKIVMEMAYGLNNLSQMNYQQIGDILHLSRERIRQIHDTSIRKIRRRMSGSGIYKKLKESVL